MLARNPWLARLFLIVLVAVSAFLLPSLTFEDDIQRGFASDSENARALAELQDLLPVRPRELLVLIETPGTLGNDELAAARDFVLDMSLIEHVVSVISPFSLRFPKDGASAGEPVFGTPIEAGIAFRALDRFSQDYPSLPTFVSADRRAMLVSASIDRALSDAQVRTVLTQVNALIADYRSSQLEFTATGEDAIAIEIVDAIRSDLIILYGVGSIAAMLVAIYLFRGIRWTTIAYVPAILSALVSLAIYPLFGFPVTVINLVIPILVLVLALADSVHLVSDFRAKGGNTAEKLERTLGDMLPANARTSITTALGFAAIGASGFDQLDEVAILGATGAMAAYWVVAAAFGALLPFAPRSDAPAPMAILVPGFVSRWALNRSMPILVIALCAALLSLYQLRNAEPWFPVYQNLPESSQVRYAHRQVEDRFGGYLRLWIEVQRKPGEEDPPLRLAAVSEALRAVAPGKTIISETAMADFSSLAATAGDGFAGLADLLNARDSATHRIFVILPEPMHDRESRDTQDRIVAAVKAAGADRLVGQPMVLRHDTLDIVFQLGRGLLIACLLATAFLALVYRSVRLVPVIILPNLLPVAITAGFTSWLYQGQISPTAVLALTVAFGIAVDDTIHFLNGYSRERARSASVDAAISRTIAQTGKAMLATTILISIGIASTFASDFSTVRLFGMMLILTFASALVCDLLLLPALIKRGWWQ